MPAINVEITAEDIAAAKRGNCEKCPIALALKREWPGWIAQVGCTIVLERPGEEVRIPASRSAGAFIRAFDGGEKVALGKLFLGWHER